MSKFTGYAALEPGKPLSLFSYDPGSISPEEVELNILSCGLCHSDVSMINNEWNMSQFPFIPGHEIIGEVAHVGEYAANRGLKKGQKVGLGWFSHSCNFCRQCIGGHHNRCADAQMTMGGGRHGGFADKVRCHWEWAAPLPDDLNLDSAGPLFCGGITVFSPIVSSGVRPTDCVGVIGIGGLGHLALQFLNKWGCEVTAFTSSPDKAEEAYRLGAHHVVNSRSREELESQAGRFNFILSTVNVSLEWKAYINALAPGGKLHNVGAIPDPIPVEAFDLIMGERSLGGSPLGSPALIRDMLSFCARHNIAPVTETFDMTDINNAIQHLEEGKARYRLILKN